MHCGNKSPAMLYQTDNKIFWGAIKNWHIFLIFSGGNLCFSVFIGLQNSLHITSFLQLLLKYEMFLALSFSSHFAFAHSHAPNFFSHLCNLKHLLADDKTSLLLIILV